MPYDYSTSVLLRCDPIYFILGVAIALIVLWLCVWFLEKKIKTKRTHIINLQETLEGLKKKYDVGYIIHADYHATYTSLDADETTLRERLAAHHSVKAKDILIKSIQSRGGK